MAGYLIDVEALKADLRIFLYIDKSHEGDRCSYCGQPAGAHYCPPHEAARRRLEALATGGPAK